MNEDEQEPEEDRADRLSRRRKDRSGSDRPQSIEERSTGNTDNTDNTVKMDNPESSDGTSNSGNPSESIRLSQTTKEQMMHLPKDQHKRLHHLYTRMKAEYEYEYDDDFEMNRQYFPLVLRYGLDQFEEQSAEEIRRDLAEFAGSQPAPEEEHND
jgi:hypothetical protein